MIYNLDSGAFKSLNEKVTSNFSVYQTVMLYNYYKQENEVKEVIYNE